MKSEDYQVEGQTEEDGEIRDVVVDLNEIEPTIPDAGPSLQPSKTEV